MQAIVGPPSDFFGPNRLGSDKRFYTRPLSNHFLLLMIKTNSPRRLTQPLVIELRQQALQDRHEHLAASPKLYRWLDL